MVALGGPRPALAETVLFAPTDAEVVNPERGFWSFAAEDFSTATREDMDSIRAAGMTLAYGVVRLDGYRAGPLPASLLDRLRGAFAASRAAGVKVILRFAYNYPESSQDYERAEDAPLAVVLGHIAQLRRTVAENADVIAVWQAGFIGAWGEGHTSSNGLDQPARKRVIRDTLLAALPPGRTLQWRYPADLIRWYPDPRDAARARIGVHNDCFLSSPTDSGTYDEQPALRGRQRAYVASLSSLTPFGGETCDAEPDAVRTGCDAILTEGRRFHLTTLGRDYYRAFHDRWAKDGCYSTIERTMGYRVSLVSAGAPDRVARGETAVATVRLRNIGWARPINPRQLVLRLVHLRTGRTYTISGGGIENLDPGAGRAATFRFPWRVAASAPSGAYALALAAPDASPSLATDPRYALRFANAHQPSAGQVWNAKSGSFRLGLTIAVTP